MHGHSLMLKTYWDKFLIYIFPKTRTRVLGWNMGRMGSILPSSLSWWGKCIMLFAALLPNVLIRTVDWNTKWLVNQKLFGLQMMFVYLTPGIGHHSSDLPRWFWERMTKCWSQQNKWQFMTVEEKVCNRTLPLPIKQKIYWVGRRGPFPCCL